MAIPQHFIQELLARADVVEIVGRYVQLKKTGANFSGLCPFHGEKTPSFTVSPSKQFFHCFGCGKNGNAIGFLMEFTGAGFVEVVHDLAQQYGLPVPEDERSPAERARAAQETEQRASLTDVLARAADAYRQHLKSSPRAIDYLKRRGVSGAVARDFGLGYAPEGWRTLAGVFPDYADAQLQDSGLVIVGEDDDDKRYDRFRDRIMFPIRDVKGQVIGFGGRVLGDEKPKYLNSPETPVFHKGRELYGLFEARGALREHGYALVTEGYMDVVALAQLGFANAVATLGTACTPEHVHKLFRFTDSVVFSFDGDAAGRRAAHKALAAALPLASDVRSIKFLFLPPEHDPDSFVRAEGAGAFEQAVQAAVPLSRFVLDAAAQDCDMETAEGRSHFAANARPLWQLLPAGALAAQLLGDIAAQVRIGVHELQQLWGLRGAARPPRERAHAPAADRGATRGPAAPTRPPLRAAAPRTAPSSRAHRALQIVLTAPGSWQALSGSDHQLLCEQAAPYGPLFAWLDGQVLEHGPQPWSALREALRGHPQEDAAVRAIEGLHDEIDSDPRELQDILRQERPVHLKQRMDAALAAGDVALYQSLLPELAKAKTGEREAGGY
ncbi:MAG: DNA primase [Burkholderiales bacterium]|uniref:DNA primase n=1 Tax=Ottowia sp. TaxID=1898956 RepID=UPI001AC3F7AF|nr:DNA primase [Ottowia sp.]MBN9404563.1 DNA primase [Burkholderiales bacterium]MBS0414656.1 DNA primase [Pseudomonadota bacterium]